MSRNKAERKKEVMNQKEIFFLSKKPRECAHAHTLALKNTRTRVCAQTRSHMDLHACTRTFARAWVSVAKEEVSALSNFI